MHNYLLWLIQVLLICCACKLGYLSVSSDTSTQPALFCVSLFLFFVFILTNLTPVANQMYMVFRFLQESSSQTFMAGLAIFNENYYYS